ncbi:MAG: hypothetical protein HETSPECPRED_001219 [Heterodermia speciosa]|uniref:Uncharacterized protein n=1 Tax=Heterodermia speciosa TaxID=116794 RepID=A0A8H3IC09_9LECA|nr:MAG: hypothetical protein HETSPECPRED_001219 [Heterodermia speciosa]
MAISSGNNPRGFQMLQVSIAVGIIASLAVALRFLARWRSKALYALDDWLLVGSLLPFYGMLAISKSLFDAGLGMPAKDLDQIPKILKVP